MSSRHAVWLATLSFALAACGARLAPVGSFEGTVGSPPGPATTVAPDGSSDDGRIAVAEQHDPTIVPTIPAEAPAHAFGELTVTVRIEPRCATRGGALTATIEATPGAAVALAVSYSDGDTYGQFGTYRTGPGGRLTYPWTVPVAAPTGTAKLILGATDEERALSGGGVWEFLVAPGIATCQETGS